MTSLERTITAVAARCVRGELPIERDTPFAWLGLDSLATIELAAALESELGCELPADVLAECRSVRALAARITRDGLQDRAADPVDLMLADAQLAADIVPRLSQERSTALREARTILVTGATGFLGSALVDVLLRETDAHLVCLARPGRTLPPSSRLRQVEGDLARPALGLRSATYDALAGEVDAVLHCGAAVNWVYSYAGLREANVVGTSELLRLACRADAPFHFVSSLSVCYAQDGPAAADEHFDGLPHVRGIHLGYAQTKVVGEALVREAGARGLPVRIYRPALISGHSVTGDYNRDDLIATLVRGCVAMGSAPDLDWTLDALPVDVVARAILSLSAGDEVCHHIDHPRPRHWRECVFWMRLYGYDVRLLSYPAWLRQLERETRNSPDHPLRPLRSFFTDRPSRARGLTLPELFEDRRRTRAVSFRTHAHLTAAGVHCPPLDAALLDTYFDAFVASADLPSPGLVGRVFRPGESSRTSSHTAPVADTITSALRDAGVPVRRVEILSTGSDHSIVSELTAWRSRRPSGLFRARVTRKDGTAHRAMVKLKARDEDVIAVGEALAAIVDRPVGEAYRRWSGRLGFAASHVREVAIFRQQDPRFLAHAPRTLATVSDDASETWMLVQEDLADARLLDSVDRPAAWTEPDIAAVIEGLAALQAIWLARDAELLAQPWIGHVHSAASMTEMSALWTALADHAAPLFSMWADPDLTPLHRRLAANPADWWTALDACPRTLLHGDFNPRNLCLRGAPSRLCAYDWELATLGAPQRDLAEFLCFVLPADTSAAALDGWVDRHRLTLSAHSGIALDGSHWRDGFRSALCDLLVNRLSVYAMVHRVRPQRFLPRVVRTWRHLYRLASEERA